MSVEVAKINATTDVQMTRLGRSQQRTSVGYFALINRSNRRDLARCYQRALRTILSTYAKGDDWLHRLPPPVAIADRARSATAARALLSVTETLHTWHEEARRCHFLDDDYNDQQILLSSWDGELTAICETAADRLRELDPLRIASSH